MPISDALAYVHGTGSTNQGSISNNNGVYGDALLAAGNQYSNLELDYGAPNNGSTFPYITQFPSLYEKNSTGMPPVTVGAGGVGFGLHIQIEQAFNNSIGNTTFTVCTANFTNATNAGNNNIASRVLSYAQMQAAGAHYYIPVNPAAVLEFLRFYATITSGNNALAGTITSWFGQPSGGEL
jgi:hypothetical protein